MGDSLIDREGGNAGRRMIVLYFAGHGPGTGMTEDVREEPGKARGYESDGAKDQKGLSES